MSEWKEFPLSKLFDITFGNKFDYNKMTEREQQGFPVSV